MYPIAGVSALLTIVSFVLVMLTIFAGNKPGFMEDYHILYFNTSTLGENLIPNLKVRVPMPEPTAPPALLDRFHAAPDKRIDIGGALNDVGNGIGDGLNQVGSVAGGVATAAASAATEAAGKGLDALQDIQNDIADKLAKELGIKEFYSIHLVDLCQGDFSPKPTDPEATFDVENCTEPFNYNLLNITALLDKQLGVGPFQLNLADLGLTDDIQDKLDDVPKIIQAIVAMYIIGAIFVLLCLFGSCGAIAIIPNSDARMIVMGNVGLSGAAVFFLLLGNLVTTIGSGVVVNKVTDLGDDIGLSAVRGGKFMALSWGAFVLMLLTAFYWVYEFIAEKKRAHDRAIGGGQAFKGFNPESEMSESNSTIGPRADSMPTANEQPQQSYGSTYDSNPYDSNPYDSNPHDSNPYAVETQNQLVSPRSQYHNVDLGNGRVSRSYVVSPMEPSFQRN